MSIAIFLICFISFVCLVGVPTSCQPLKALILIYWSGCPYVTLLTCFISLLPKRVCSLKSVTATYPALVLKNMSVQSFMRFCCVCWCIAIFPIIKDVPPLSLLKEKGNTSAHLFHISHAVHKINLAMYL